MMKFHKILSSLVLINVALLVLFINNAKTSATRFHSTTIEANGDLMLPEKVNQFGRQGRTGFAHNVYFNTRERLGDHSRSHYHSFQPGNGGRILRLTPSGPNEKHNPITPAGNVGRILRLTPSGPNEKHNPITPAGNVGHILRLAPSGPNKKHNPNIPGAHINV
ncbi:uncharacterized protein LOC131614669 [Vicia villosa]|uniref:uncharacterized protein LOC131614669 n=1 Tax=Vicia villosa TaxID=3911 RepID=UPI00273B36B2|nr:uncharacterized protein LOC131614669 [Vicia villosa]